MSTVILQSFDFTVSVGNPGTDDVAFSDLYNIGGFPYAQNIQKVMRIEVFSGTDAGDDAVIVGLKIHYKMLDGNEKIASHGLVHADPVGDFSISDHQILVGVFGRLKTLPNNSNNDRVATIGFVLFDTNNATLTPKGPFYGSQVHLGQVYADFDHIVAFQGTRKPASSSNRDTKPYFPNKNCTS